MDHPDDDVHSDDDVPRDGAVCGEGSGEEREDAVVVHEEECVEPGEESLGTGAEAPWGQEQEEQEELEDLDREQGHPQGEI